MIGVSKFRTPGYGNQHDLPDSFTSDLVPKHRSKLIPIVFLGARIHKKQEQLVVSLRVPGNHDGGEGWRMGLGL